MLLKQKHIAVAREVRDAVFHGSTILGLVLIGVVWLVVGLHIEGERINAEQAAIQNGANLAGAFEEHLSRSLNEIDRSIKVIRAEYLDEPDFDLRVWLNRSPLFDDQTLQVSIVSREGYIKASSVISASSVGTDLRDREHFKFQASAIDDQLHVSKPVIGRTTSKWSVQLTRRIVGPDGAFDGMIVASLDPRIPRAVLQFGLSWTRRLRQSDWCRWNRTGGRRRPTVANR